MTGLAVAVRDQNIGVFVKCIELVRFQVHCNIYDTALDRRMVELSFKHFHQLLTSKCEFKNKRWTFKEQNVFQ